VRSVDATDFPGEADLDASTCRLFTLERSAWPEAAPGAIAVLKLVLSAL
jgi:hypothetical protein